MRGLVDRPAVHARLQKLLGNSKTVTDEVFLKAFKEAADRGYGKAIQPLEHQGPDGGPIPVEGGDALRERIARELAGIAARTAAGKTP